MFLLAFCIVGGAAARHDRASVPASHALRAGAAAPSALCPCISPTRAPWRGCALPAPVAQAVGSARTRPGPVQAHPRRGHGIVIVHVQFQTGRRAPRGEIDATAKVIVDPCAAVAADVARYSNFCYWRSIGVDTSSAERRETISPIVADRIRNGTNWSSQFAVAVFPRFVFEQCDSWRLLIIASTKVSKGNVSRTRSSHTGRVWRPGCVRIDLYVPNKVRAYAHARVNGRRRAMEGRQDGGGCARKRCDAGDDMVDGMRDDAGVVTDVGRDCRRWSGRGAGAEHDTQHQGMHHGHTTVTSSTQLHAPGMSSRHGACGVPVLVFVCGVAHRDVRPVPTGLPSWERCGACVTRCTGPGTMPGPVLGACVVRSPARDGANGHQWRLWPWDASNGGNGWQGAASPLKQRHQHGRECPGYTIVRAPPEHVLSTCCMHAPPTCTTSPISLSSPCSAVVC